MFLFKVREALWIIREQVWRGGERHSTPTDVARDRFTDCTQYVG